MSATDGQEANTDRSGLCGCPTGGGTPAAERARTAPKSVLPGTRTRSAAIGSKTTASDVDGAVHAGVDGIVAFRVRANNEVLRRCP